MPVATAKMFGSKMMSSAGIHGVGQQLVRAPADLHLALDRVGLALLVEGHHHDGGPVGPDAPCLLEERALASLRLIELTMPLPAGT